MTRRSGNVRERRPAVLLARPTYSARDRLQIPPDKARRAAQTGAIKRRYAVLLRRYLDERQEEALLEVYRLGREAVVEEIGLLNIADIHHAALRDVLANTSPVSPEQYERAGSVLSEFLSAYEMASRGYREASTAMRHLNEMLEDEVRRIAHAIHDGAGQYLACVHISLYGIAKHSEGEAKKELARAHELLDELERHLRRVSHELRPRVLENSGLAGAVEFLVDGVGKRTGLDIHIANSLTERPPTVIETALYRCIQEMLNNVVKHAGAKNVWIALEARGGQGRGQLQCEVRDDGVGFDARATLARDDGPQLGFLGIQERIAALGGKVAIESARGAGTRIVIRVPL